MDVYLPSESRERLLNLARQTLEDFVRGSQARTTVVDDRHLHTRDYGVFVSLHKQKELRGCIGTCFPKHPLYRSVVEMTRAAASRDHRVAPIVSEELDDIHIDISILSPLEAASDPLSLEVGRHGLHVTCGGNRGVLLPQVALEYCWNMKAFLEHTCVKAGLPKDAWTWADTRVSSFTALIIEEPT